MWEWEWQLQMYKMQERAEINHNIFGGFFSQETIFFKPEPKKERERARERSRLRDRKFLLRSEFGVLL